MTDQLSDELAIDEASDEQRQEEDDGGRAYRSR
jgi:hypothetical protein